MNRTFHRVMSCGLVAAAMVISSCGGGNDTTSAGAESAGAESSVTTAAATTPSTAPPATAAPITAAPTTTATPAASFDTAVGDALRASGELAALRTACFDDSDPAGCLLAAEADITTAEIAAIDAVTAMGAAATAAGLPADQCADYVGYASENIATERQLLIERATAVALAEDPIGSPEWDYFGGLIDSRISPAGHELALLIVDCIDGVRNLNADSSLARNVSSFVFNADVRTRPSLSYNLWTMIFCVDRPPLDGRSCLDGLGLPDPLVSHFEELGYAYDDLLADPGYADLPTECRAAIEDSTARLRSSYEIYLGLSTRDLVGTDIELLESLALANHQVEYQDRLMAKVPRYPLDEVMVLDCAAAVADITI